MDEIKNAVARAFKKRLLFTPHCVNQMNKPERVISASEIREVIQSGRIIEDYPEDRRGHSCLVMGSTSTGRSIHVVCSPKDEYLAIITAYIPDSKIWDITLMKRMR